MLTAADRLQGVRNRMAAAVRRAGRSDADVQLVAVSKRHSAAAIAEVHGLGVRDFGENFAQEFARKRTELADRGADIEWHFIGHLQRNKVKLVVGAASLIHTVDSERLLRAIAKRARELGIVQRILVEVNVAGEASKSGIAPAQCGALIELAAQIPDIGCDGLMSMPPWPDRAEHSRPHFRELVALRDSLSVDRQPLPELSMGTSADLEVAIEEGATLVRVGTDVFGPRPQST